MKFLKEIDPYGNKANMKKIIKFNLSVVILVACIFLSKHAQAAQYAVFKKVELIGTLAKVKFIDSVTNRQAVGFELTLSSPIDIAASNENGPAKGVLKLQLIPDGKNSEHVIFQLDSALDKAKKKKFRGKFTGTVDYAISARWTFLPHLFRVTKFGVLEENKNSK